jgi:cell wall assembly regulator SMI1
MLINLLIHNMIETSLNTIRERLTEIAPRIIEFSLNAGATQLDFDKLEHLVGKKLPNDFKKLYKTYNGINDDENWGSFFYGMTFSSIDDIIADYEFRVNQSKNIQPFPLEKFDPQIDGTNLYNLGWLRIGSDGSRSGLFVDLAPTDKGNYGQVIFIDSDYNVGIFVAISVSELVDNFAVDLQNNLYYLEPDALEDGQHFLETKSSIDLANWFTVDKWKHLSNK